MNDRVVIIDNYDSFTYNLFQYLAELGAEVLVHRNDAVSVEDIRAMDPTHLVISPGPKTPTEAGISVEAIQAFGGAVPVLGVCLGHQAIGQAFGGRVVRGPEPMHGKTSDVRHDGRSIFRGIDNPMGATRYHSLVVTDIPDVLEVSAWCEDDIVMGLRHRTLPIEGVQFHPESILTTAGMTMLANFLEMAA